MPFRSKHDKTLSDLGDDSDDLTPTKADNKSNRKGKRRKHVVQKSKRSRLNLNDFYRSTVNGEGLDLFIQTKIFQDYLQCETKPWTYPKRSTDKIELEPIPSTFLPSLSNDPLYFKISGKNKRSERVRRVCGYREIFMKRMHAKYLEDKEREEMYSILYPEKAIQELDSSVVENDVALKKEIQRRFHHLGLGGGSKKKKEHDKSKDKKKSKSKHKSKNNSRLTSRLSKSKLRHPEYYEVENEKKRSTHHKSRNKNKRKDKSRSRERTLNFHKKLQKVYDGRYESRSSSRLENSPNRDRSRHKSKKQGKSAKREESGPPRPKRRKVSISKGRNRIRGHDHSQFHSKIGHRKSKVQGQGHSASQRKVVPDTFLNPNHKEISKQHTDFRRREVEKAEEKVGSQGEKYSKSDKTKTSSSKPSNFQESSEIQSKTAKHYKSKGTQKTPNSEAQIRNNFPGPPQTAASRDQNNNVIFQRPDQPEKWAGESHKTQKPEPQPTTKVLQKLDTKKHAELLSKKLEDWANNGNHHRIHQPQKLSQPDENANYLISESSKNVSSPPDNGIVFKKGSANTGSGPGPRPHTVVTIHDQTPSKIAAQFRTQPISVYTAAVNKDQASHSKHANPGHHAHSGQAGHTNGPSTNTGHHPHGQDHGHGDKPHHSSQAGNKHGKGKGHHHNKHKLAKFDITNFDAYYEYVFGEKIKDMPERDSEWLELSATDEDELDEEIQSFEKPTPAWMIKGLSFESQQLVTELQLMYWTCLLTGRMFYYTKPNFQQGHIEFLTKRWRMIPFFVSSFILWASLVIMSQSYASIAFEEKQKDNITRGSGQQQVLIEQLEIKKYGEVVLYVIANLAFVAVWSVFVILRDGQLITHYFNCWCPALAEMETSSAIRIRRMTFYNLLAWFIPSGLLVAGFCMKFPDNIRGTSGLLAILMFRNVYPDIRLRNATEIFYFQLFGLIFIIYVLFCARMLFNLMQIIALIIKNSAEMWNFKFALAFNQLMMTNRGHMKRISLQLPLVKFFTHHRIMTALVKIYGEIFGVPIMIYMVVQIGLLTYVLVHLFNYKAGNTQDYNGKSEVDYEFYAKHRASKTIVHIEFYHSPVEEISTGLFILVMVCFDYIFTTEVLASASQSFCDGFEFVRRTNLILCKTSHQRRLIQSLLWSMSATNPTLLSAGHYFRIYRPTIVAGLGVAIAFFSLIIQLQSDTEIFYIEFPPCTNQTNKYTIQEPRCKPKGNKTH